MQWYDEARIGKYLPQYDSANVSDANSRSNTVGGGIMACRTTAAGRSYAAELLVKLRLRVGTMTRRPVA